MNIFRPQLQLPPISVIELGVVSDRTNRPLLDQLGPLALYWDHRKGNPSPVMERQMTFEQFQATKTHCDDLGAKLSDARWEDEPVPAKGNLYLDALYIEAIQPHWPEAARKEGKWHLLIGRDEWITDDLESLERRLYDFAVSEGYCEEVEG